MLSPANVHFYMVGQNYVAQKVSFRFPGSIKGAGTGGRRWLVAEWVNL